MTAPPLNPQAAPRLGYLPGIDGLRALAVAAVFAYHAGISWIPGGFLGVDVFFVVSGYLITAILFEEWSRRGTVDLIAFWRRRALRLLPALFVMLVTVALTVPILAADQSGRLTGDVRAALLYVSNWHLIFEHQSYFEAVGRLPLLQHLWSLAVEEQFYLLWPLGLVALARRRLRPARIAAYLAGGALLSSLLMALLYTPSTDPSRAYFGTDTRMAPILVGAALACLWAPWRVARPTSPGARRTLQAVLVASMAGLGFAVTGVDRYSAGLYRGGFLVVALLAALAVAMVVHPAGLPRGSLLRSRPLLWLGRRSYGVYLWHWPILSVTRADLDVPLSGTPLVVLQAALTLGLAALSYRFVEMPVRQGALGRIWTELLVRPRWHRPRRGLVIRAGAAALVLVGLVGISMPRQAPPMPHLTAASAISSPVHLIPELIPVTNLTTPDPPADAAAVPAAPSAEVVVATTSPPDTAPPAPPDTAPPDTAPPAETAAPVVETAAPVAPPAGPVTALGDSVLLAAKPALEAALPGVFVDAAIGRQMPALIELAQGLRDSGRLAPVVIVQAGNNGPVSVTDMLRLLDVLSSATKVLVVNVEVPRPWETSNNDHMVEAVSSRPNAVLVDWHGAAAAASGVFHRDGTHLKAEGVALYCRLIISAI